MLNIRERRVGGGGKDFGQLSPWISRLQLVTQALLVVPTSSMRLCGTYSSGPVPEEAPRTPDGCPSTLSLLGWPTVCGAYYLLRM